MTKAGLAPELSAAAADSASLNVSLSGHLVTLKRHSTCSLRSHASSAIGAGPEPAGKPGGGPRLNGRFHHFRLVVVAMGGLAFGLELLLRNNITVAILKMVNQTNLYLKSHPNETIHHFRAKGLSEGGQFKWDNEIQQMIMSFYMFAYTLPQVPCTKLATLIGCRLALSGALAVSALANLLTPLSAEWGGWRWVVALRLMNGLGASSVIPMLLTLVEKYMPPEEFSFGLTILQLLQASLTTAAPLIVGYLCTFHWSYAFYVPGLVVLLFCLLWVVLIADEPERNWLMSGRKLEHLCRCAAAEPEPEPEPEGPASAAAHRPPPAKLARRTPPPNQRPGVWQVLQRPQFHAFLSIWIIYCLSNNTFVNTYPTYLRQFLRFRIEETGLYCSLIQSGIIVAQLWPHPLLRLLQNRLRLSLTGARRVAYALMCLTCAGAWLHVGLFHSGQVLALFINRSFFCSTDIVIHGTLLSNFAKSGLSGLTFSMANTVGNISFLPFSALIGYILDYTGQSRAGWSSIFIGLGAAQLLALTAFCTLVRSEPVSFPHRKRTSQTGPVSL